MELKNSPESYGLISKLFHWIMALMIFGLLGVGLYMEELDRGALKLWMIGQHKSIGMLVLFLVAARILWHAASKRPLPVAGMQPWEKLAAKAGHAFLYLAMIGMPLSGWLMSSAKGYPVSIFGLCTLPDLIGKDKELGHTLEEVHEILSTALMVAIGLHVAAAFKRHFISKDGTLRRMMLRG